VSFEFIGLFGRLRVKPVPEAHRRGELGERAAKRHLQRLGLKFLAANFRSERGEIDLVFRDADCLVFVEVKARSTEKWTRPAAAVNARKKRLLTQTALDYLRLIKNPAVSVRLSDSIIWHLHPCPICGGPLVEKRDCWGKG